MKGGDVTWKVSALQPVRYRAGRRFTPAPVLIDAADLSKAEQAALCGDPQLRVELVEPEPKPEPTPKPKPAAKGKAAAK